MHPVATSAHYSRALTHPLLRPFRWYHNNVVRLFDKFPKKGKLGALLHRIAVAIVLPFAYTSFSFVALFGAPFQKKYRQKAIALQNKKKKPILSQPEMKPSLSKPENEVKGPTVITYEGPLPKEVSPVRKRVGKLSSSRIEQTMGLFQKARKKQPKTPSRHQKRRAFKNSVKKQEKLASAKLTRQQRLRRRSAMRDSDRTDMEEALEKHGDLLYKASTNPLAHGLILPLLASDLVQSAIRGRVPGGGRRTSVGSSPPVVPWNEPPKIELKKENELNRKMNKAVRTINSFVTEERCVGNYCELLSILRDSMYSLCLFIDDSAFDEESLKKSQQDLENICSRSGKDEEKPTEKLLSFCENLHRVIDGLKQRYSPLESEGETSLYQQLTDSLSVVFDRIFSYISEDCEFEIEKAWKYHEFVRNNDSREEIENSLLINFLLKEHSEESFIYMLEVFKKELSVEKDEEAFKKELSVEKDEEAFKEAIECIFHFFEIEKTSITQKNFLRFVAASANVLLKLPSVGLKGLNQITTNLQHLSQIADTNEIETISFEEGVLVNLGKQNDSLCALLKKQSTHTGKFLLLAQGLMFSYILKKYCGYAESTKEYAMAKRCAERPAVSYLEAWRSDAEESSSGEESSSEESSSGEESSSEEDSDSD